MQSISVPSSFQKESQDTQYSKKDLRNFLFPMYQDVLHNLGETLSNYVEPSVLGETHAFTPLNQFIENFFNDRHQKSLVITGYPKSGKTFAMKAYTLQAWQKSNVLVFFVPLKEIENPFRNVLDQSLALYGLKIMDLSFDNFFKRKKVLFIFDGYDQIKFKHPTQYNISFCFSNFLVNMQNWKFIFTCDRDLFKKKLSKHVFETKVGKSKVGHLLPLDQEQILQYIDQYSLSRKQNECKISLQFYTSLKLLIVMITSFIRSQELVFNPSLEVNKPSPRKSLLQLKGSYLSIPSCLKHFLDSLRRAEAASDQQGLIANLLRTRIIKKTLQSFEIQTHYQVTGCGWYGLNLSIEDRTVFDRIKSLSLQYFQSQNFSKALLDSLHYYLDYYQKLEIEALRVDKKDFEVFKKTPKKTHSLPLTELEMYQIMSFLIEDDDGKGEWLNDENFKQVLKRYHELNQKVNPFPHDDIGKWLDK